MSSICIRGGYCLNGEVDIQGGKKMPHYRLWPQLFLNKGIVCLRRCPQISDVRHMCRLLEQMVFVLRPMETADFGYKRN